MAIEVGVSEAKTNLSRLLEKAMAGEEVIIKRSGRPLVRLTPVKPASGRSAPFRRQIGTAKGQFVVPDDFDDPLPDDILAAFEK